MNRYQVNLIPVDQPRPIGRIVYIMADDQEEANKIALSRYPGFKLEVTNE